ncbi:MAG: long-chain-fatty-acyl-CoA reductase, partial [Clostridiales bacterium]|nr:long-chain-fatty-acyl-CoA reductase [Clostridiales bacterium]
EFISGNVEILTDMPKLPALHIFDAQVLGFFGALSSELLKMPEAKVFPDVITFAFWCRNANLQYLKKQYSDDMRFGRGVAFHRAPSNVPVNFAYTLIAGMLAGNASIVRLPSKDFLQTRLICTAINKILEKFPVIIKRLCLIRYEHNSMLTDALSMLCNSRVIWGGDRTVSEIRKSPLMARSNEITFPDRYSICVINSDRYLAEYDKSQTARDFFNDTYLTDQNACTAPRFVFWLGNKIAEAKEVFWDAVYQRLDDYDLQAVQTVNKLTAMYMYAADHKCKIELTRNYKIVRVAVENITPEISDHLENSGYFYEYEAESLRDMLPVCGIKCQTLSYIGVNSEELRKFVIDSVPGGIDRVTPVGKTLDFSLIWDGIDIIRTLSRQVFIS